MKLALKFAALAFGLTAAATVCAQATTWQGMYAGVTLTRAEYKEEGFSAVNPTVVGGKIGKQFNPNFAVEGRFGIGVADDTVDAGGLPVTVEIDYYFGVYGKGILPLSSAASVYGLLGFTQAKLTASAAGFSASDSDGDISFGLGGEFNVSPKTSVSLEFARLLKGDGYRIDGLSLGVSFKF
jgi:hypothetical protein